MTESEAKAILERDLKIMEENKALPDGIESIRIAISALEEIQQYRALGTMEEIKKKLKAELPYMGIAQAKFKAELDTYKAIGTVEELQEAMEKQRARKPICKPMPYSEEVGLNDEWLCPTCGAYVGYFSEGMNEPEQMEYCTECGQHIARDWSEEE